MLNVVPAAVLCVRSSIFDNISKGAGPVAGNALALNRRNVLKTKHNFKTSRQRSYNQRFGCLQCLGSCYFGPAEPLSGCYQPSPERAGAWYESFKQVWEDIYMSKHGAEIL